MITSAASVVALGFGLKWIYGRYRENQALRQKVRESLRLCGIVDEHVVKDLCSLCSNTSSRRTFGSSRFLRVHKALTRNYADVADEAVKRTRLFNAVDALIDNYARRYDVDIQRVRGFKDSFFTEAQKHFKKHKGGGLTVPATVAAMYMWTSAKKLGGKELCSMLQSGSLCVRGARSNPRRAY